MNKIFRKKNLVWIFFASVILVLVYVLPLVISTIRLYKKYPQDIQSVFKVIRSQLPKTINAKIADVTFYTPLGVATNQSWERGLDVEKDGFAMYISFTPSLDPHFTCKEINKKNYQIVKEVLFANAIPLYFEHGYDPHGGVLQTTEARTLITRNNQSFCLSVVQRIGESINYAPFDDILTNAKLN